MESVQDSISNFITQEIIRGSADDKLDIDRQLLAEGILDSLGLQQLITFLEGKYSITVDDDYLMPEYFESVRTISDLINEILG